MPRATAGLRPVSLRFVDKDVEHRFQEQYFRDNLGYIRAGHLLVIVVWGFFGLFPVLAGGHQADATGIGLHLLIVLVAGMGLTSVSLGLTFLPGYGKWWQTPIVALVLVSSALSDMHELIIGHPADWAGVVTLMLILAFTYALIRMQYRYAALGGILVIGYYNLIRVLVQRRGDIGLLDPDIYLVAFAVIGTGAAYVLERFARLLFIRERELDRERERGDRLLRNILPEVIIGRLKARDPRVDARHIAQGYTDVTVLFADLVGFTEQASVSSPGELVTALDDVFTRFDQLADRFGLEKIKTVGDAYMAAAGVPDPRPDHGEAAAEMALEARECISGLRWPSGAPIGVRIGMACGPVMAGVIGRRKFAYDIWGDTVNTASRLETTAAPGTIQVSEAVSERLSGHYRFSEPYVVELKGKGSMTACVLQERLAAEQLPALGA